MKRNRIITTLLIVCMSLLLAFGLTACNGFTQDDIDNAVSEATAPLNEQITALEADIAEKTAKIATLEGEKTALTTEKIDLEADIQEIEAEVTALETEKATLEAEVAALEEEKSSLTTDKAALESSIADKNAEIASLNSSIYALNTEKATLTNRVSELEASITAKDTQIAELNSSIDTLTDRVAELEDENAELETRLNCFEGKHVIDTKGEISYAWSKDYSTCTATGVCVYCDGEATEMANGITGDNKITATFENSALEAQEVHTVTTYDELNALLQSGEVVTIRLDATLENIQSLSCNFGTTAVLDMNGNDITFEVGYGLGVFESSLALKGMGTITASGKSAIYCDIGTLFIEDNVTVNGTWYAISLIGNDYGNTTVNISGGTINAQGNGVNFDFINDYTSLTITGGTFSCDPTEYVDTTKYTVTQNKDGMYVVMDNAEIDYEAAFKDLQNQINCLKGNHEPDGNDCSTTITCVYCDTVITEAQDAHSYSWVIEEDLHYRICQNDGCEITDTKEAHDYDETTGACVCGDIMPYLYDDTNNTYNVYTGDGLNEVITVSENTSFTIKLMANVATTTIVTIDSGYEITLDLNRYTWAANCDNAVINKGTLTIREGTITNEYDYGAAGVIYSYGDDAILNIEEGVTVTGKHMAVKGGGKECTINGAIITGKHALWLSQGDITINGGTYTATDTDGFAVYCNGTNSVAINDGSFTGTVWASDTSNLTIQGGTFSANPTSWVDITAYDVSLNADNGTYTVTAKSEE